MSPHSRQRKSARRKRRIQKRLAPRQWRDQPRPMFGARNIHYDVAGRGRATGVGGIGAMLLLAQRVGLVRRIDEHLHVLKRHLPYHESDHTLNIPGNLLAGGDCLQDLERLRQDEAYLDALGAHRLGPALRLRADAPDLVQQPCGATLDAGDEPARLLARMWRSAPSGC